MSRSSKSDQTADFANRAIDMMRQYGVAPHPRNFEIWYAYAAGGMPQLNCVIDALVSQGTALDEPQTETLHKRFFSDEAENIQVSEATAKLEEELGRIIDALGQADGTTREFGLALATFTGALQGGGERELKAALGQIVGATTEMRRRNTALETQLDQSAGEIHQLRGDLDLMRQQAFTDALTQIANRKMFDQELERLALETKQNGTGLCLLMLDIDHFKHFNDSYGHQIGDQVLKLLAATLKECVKGRDLPARYGGEEFSIILPDTHLENAIILAEQVRQAIGGKRVINKQTHQDLGRITVSIGASQLTGDEALGSLIGRADEALYLAKAAGRNRVASQADLANEALSEIAKTG